MSLDLQGIFDALLEGVLLLDEAGRVRECNAEALRLLGVNAEIARDEVLDSLLGENHPLCGLVDRVRTSGRPAIHDEVEFPRREMAPEGERAWEPIPGAWPPVEEQVVAGEVGEDGRVGVRARPPSPHPSHPPPTPTFFLFSSVHNRVPKSFTKLLSYDLITLAGVLEIHSTLR